MDSTNNEEDGEQSELLYDGGKKGRIFVIDFGQHMFEEGGWRFRLALQAVRDQINKLCCIGDQGELNTIVFANTANNNEMAENTDACYVHRKLSTMDAEYMKGLDAILQEKDLKAQFAPELGESGVCDWAQLFFLCERLFVNARTVLRKKIINVFTTDIVDIESGSQEASKKRVSHLREKNTEIKVYLIEKEIGGETESGDFWNSIDPDAQRCSSLDDLVQNLHFKNYTMRSSTSLPFVLADGVQISVGLYYLVVPQAKPPAIRLDAETNERIEQRTHYIPKEVNVEDNSAAAVSDANLPGTVVEGECFEGEVNFTRDVGGQKVVLDREEFEKLRRFDKPGITVIGFKPLKLLKPSHRMSPAKFIYPLENVIAGSTNVYRALLHRCLARQLFILVRCTQKTNTTPQLCALVPQTAKDQSENGNNLPKNFFYEGFHLLELPFAEASRNLRSFERYSTPNGVGVWDPPKAEQVKAAEDFVAKITIPDFSPDQFFNPMLQRHYKAVEAVALDLDMKSFEEEANKLDTLKAYFQNPETAKHVAPELEKLKKVCQFEGPVESPKKGRPKAKLEPKEEEEKDDADEDGFARPATKRGRKKAGE